MASTVWRAFRRLFSKEAKDQPPAGDQAWVVLLLREPREVSEPVLAHAAKRAWKASFAGEDSPNFIVQEGPLCLIKFGGELLQLLNSVQPWGADATKAAKAIPELRCRKAWSDHGAWISITSMSSHANRTEAIQKMPMLAKLAAELLNANCTAVYFPENNVLIPNDSSLSERLRQFRSLEQLVTDSVVINADEAKWERIVAEARARWPEFCQAFADRQPADAFFVKALFTEADRGEWMWVRVESLNDGLIGGSLQNSPVELSGLGLGDQVEVAAGEIGDWLYSLDGTDYGGFSRALYE